MSWTFKHNGREFTREDIEVALREMYEANVKWENHISPGISSFPDLKAAIEHICEHGLPPKVEPAPMTVSEAEEALEEARYQQALELTIAEGEAAANEEP